MNGGNSSLPFLFHVFNITQFLFPRQRIRKKSSQNSKPKKEARTKPATLPRLFSSYRLLPVLPPSCISSTSAERKFAISFEKKSACNRRSRSTCTVQETRATDSAHSCCSAAESTLNCKKWFPGVPKANSDFPFPFEKKLRMFRNVSILPWSPLFIMPRIPFFWRKMESY